MTNHARPDIPQPDPVVRDRPGDLPPLPCADDRDDFDSGTPQAAQQSADQEPPAV